MDNLAIEPGPGNHRILGDNPTPNNGISRAFYAVDATWTDFRNPTDSLTIKDINAVKNGSIDEFHGLDALDRPDRVVLDANNRADTLRFTGAATSVVADYVNDLVFVDGQIVETPSSGPTTKEFLGDMVHFTLHPSAGNHRILSDDGSPHDGVSRAINADDYTCTDFVNPTNSLTIRDTNATGTSIYEFQGIDDIGRPASIGLDAGTRPDIQRFTGTATNVVEDLFNDRVIIDGLAIGVPGANASAIIDMSMVNFTLILQPNNQPILMEDGTARDGVSRSFNADQQYLLRLPQPDGHAERAGQRRQHADRKPGAGPRGPAAVHQPERHYHLDGASAGAGGARGPGGCGTGCSRAAGGQQPPGAAQRGGCSGRGGGPCPGSPPAASGAPGICPSPPGDRRVTGMRPNLLSPMLWASRGA